MTRTRTTERRAPTASVAAIEAQGHAVTVRDLEKTYPGPDGRSVLPSTASPSKLATAGYSDYWDPTASARPPPCRSSRD
jgi:hypothetical protein